MARLLTITLIVSAFFCSYACDKNSHNTSKTDELIDKAADNTKAAVRAVEKKADAAAQEAKDKTKKVIEVIKE